MKDRKPLSLNTAPILTLLCLLSSSLIGCYSAAVDYDLGWTTRKVSGQVEDVVSGKPVRGGFIIVKEFYGSFSGNEVHRFRFQRQLGVGNLHYVAKMMPSAIWADELVLGVTPLVQNLLLEPGYRLPEPDQLFLGEWLATQRQENFGTE